MVRLMGKVCEDLTFFLNGLQAPHTNPSCVLKLELKLLTGALCTYFRGEA